MTKQSKTPPAKTKQQQVDVTVVDHRHEATLPKDIIEAVALNGLVNSQQGSMLTNLAYNNCIANGNLGQTTQLSNQQAQSRQMHSIVASAVKQTQQLQPLQARSAVDTLTNNDVAQRITDLSATLKAVVHKRNQHHGKRLPHEQ